MLPQLDYCLLVDAAITMRGLKRMEQITLELHGKQEKFTEKFGNHYYECYLKRFWLQEGRVLVIFARYWGEDYCESDEYSTIVNEYDKRIKLIGEIGNRLPKDICKVLNKRFSDTWNIKFM